MLVWYLLPSCISIYLLLSLHTLECLQCALNQSGRLKIPQGVLLSCVIMPFNHGLRASEFHVTRDAS